MRMAKIWKQKFLASSLSVVMASSIIPVQTWAVENDTMPQDTNTITSLDLPEDVRTQMITVGSEQEPNLPSTLDAVVTKTTWEEVITSGDQSDITTGSALNITTGSAIGTTQPTVSYRPMTTEEEVEVEVEWVLEEDVTFSTLEASTFTYSAEVVGSTYAVAKNVEMPTITVQVVEDRSAPIMVATWDELQDAFNKGGEVILTQDIVADPAPATGGHSPHTTLKVHSNTTVTLDLNGYKIDRNLAEATNYGDVIRIFEGSHMTINDSSGNHSGMITGGYSGEPYSYGGAGISVEGTLILNGGTICDNKNVGNNSYHVGGVYVGRDGTFNMNDGHITRNTSEKGYASGVMAMTNATFNMLGGSIRENVSSATYGGGGIYSYEPVVYANDVTVIDNYVMKDGKKVPANVTWAGGIMLSEENPLAPSAQIGIFKAENESTGSGLLVRQSPGARDYAKHFFMDNPALYVGTKADDPDGIYYAEVANPGDTIPAIVKVTFDPMNGEGTKAISVEELTAMPTAPTWGNYRFAGWYTDTTYQNEAILEELQATEYGATVYAKWTTAEGKPVNVEGDFLVVGGTKDTDYTYADNTLTVLTDTELTVANRDASVETTSTIVVPVENTNANIILEGVNIKTDIDAPIEILGSATLTLADGTMNTLETTAFIAAGLQVQEGATVTLKGSTLGTGELTAIGGSRSAAIGSNGNYDGSVGTINIESGIIYAIPVTRDAAGIGGGYMGTQGGTVTISGGTVSTTGAIGSGSNSEDVSVHITGGTVSAGNMETGTGLHIKGDDASFTMSGGEVTTMGGASGIRITSNATADITGGVIEAMGTYDKGIEVISGGSITIADTMEFATSNTAIPDDTATYTKGNGVVGQFTSGDKYATVRQIIDQVTFDPINGEEPTTILVEDLTTMPTAPTWGNYNFQGWYTDTTYQNEVTLEALQAVENRVTVYAKWTTAAGEPVNVEGDFLVIGGTKGTDYTYADNTLTVLTDTELTVANRDVAVETTSTIVVPATNINANIILKGVNIASETDAPIEVLGSATMTLAGDTSNTLATTGSEKAGLQVNTGATVILKGDVLGNGELTATGGMSAAGIGSDGNYDTGAGTITIESGVIHAIPGDFAAAIGTGYMGAGGTVTITGGTVSTEKSIGSGANSRDVSVHITGGTVTTGNATDGTGFVINGENATFNMSGGEVTAIGGGAYGRGMLITSNANAVITGGMLQVTGGDRPAVEMSSDGTITIDDTMTFATSNSAMPDDNATYTEGTGVVGQFTSTDKYVVVRQGVTRVVFDPNNGQAPVEVEKPEQGGIIIPDDITWENYVIEGWYTESTLENKLDNTTIESLDESTTLYAKWTRDGKKVISQAIHITDDTETTDKLATEGWKWDAETSTLILDGFTMDMTYFVQDYYGQANFTIEVTNGVTVQLVAGSTNKMQGGESGLEVYNDANTLVFEGTGQLAMSNDFANITGILITIEEGQYDLAVTSIDEMEAPLFAMEGLIINGGTVNTQGLMAGILTQNLIVNDGTVNALGEIAGILSFDEVMIQSGTVHAEGGMLGIIGLQGITIQDGTIVASSDMGGMLSFGSVVIDDGTVTTEGIVGLENITINNGTVIAESNTSGMLTFGNVLIDNGRVTTNGIVGLGNVTINDGIITTDGSTAGILGAQYIEMNNGTVHATGDMGGVMSLGNVTINNGKLTAKGDMAGVLGIEYVAINEGEVTAEGMMAAIAGLGAVVIDGGEVQAIATEDVASGIPTLGAIVLAQDAFHFDGGKFTATTQAGEAKPAIVVIVDENTLEPAHIQSNTFFTVRAGDDAQSATQTPYEGQSYVEIATQGVLVGPEAVEGRVGEDIGNLTATPINFEGTVAYQWYRHTENSTTGGTPITGANRAVYTLPTDLTIGTHYYYVEATDAVEGTFTSAVVPVEVKPTITDEEAVIKVKELIEQATFEFTQATANNEADALFEIVRQINALEGMESTGIVITIADITLDSFTAAKDGVDGGFNFTVAIAKGEEATTTTKQATIIATPNHNISGSVKDTNNQPVAGAKVTIIVDGTEKTAVTDANGHYTMNNVPEGIYTIEIEKDGKTQTASVVVDDATMDEVIFVTEGNKNTSVAVGAGVPTIVVDNLQNMFDGTENTTDKVDITLDVEKVDAPVDQTLVDDVVLGQDVVGMYFDIELFKTTTPQGGEGTTTVIQPPAGTTVEITIKVPVAHQNKAPYTIVRVHDGKVATLEADYNAVYHTITFEADKFSTYAYTYTDASVETHILTVEGTTATSGDDYANGDIIRIAAGTKAGYTFINWTTTGGVIADVNSAETTFTMPNEDVTLTANWKKDNDDTDDDNDSDDDNDTDNDSDNDDKDSSETDTAYKPVFEVGENGTISVTPKAPSQGEEVTITVKPDAGYTLDELHVTDAKDRAVKVKDNGDGTYTFEQPSTAVTITVTFEKIEEETQAQTGVKLDKTNHMAYMSGVDAHTFAPNRSITRAEVVVMFSRVMADKMTGNQTYTSTFTDITGDEWYANTIGYMEQFNIVGGYEDGTFKPNQPITRAEFAAIASRFETFVATEHNIFDDVAANYWAAPFINSVAAQGFVKGYEDGTFRPTQNITRAEAVVIVNNMLGRTADTAFIADNIVDITTFEDVTSSHWAYSPILEATNAHEHTISDDKEVWTDLN